jgi:hypothetical protein
MTVMVVPCPLKPARHASPTSGLIHGCRVCALAEPHSSSARAQVWKVVDRRLRRVMEKLRRWWEKWKWKRKVNAVSTRQN